MKHAPQLIDFIHAVNAIEKTQADARQQMGEVAAFPVYFTTDMLISFFIDGEAPEVAHAKISQILMKENLVTYSSRCF